MRAEVLRSYGQFERMKDDWTELVSHMESPDLYDTWEWISACLTDYHGRDADLFLVVVYDGDTCVAAAPLHRLRTKVGGMPVRSLHWIAYGTAMYSGFCLHKDYNESVLLKHIKDALRERSSEWDLMTLGFMNSKNNATFLARKVFGSSYKVYTEEADFVPYLNYGKSRPGKWNAKELKDIERRQRKLMREHDVKVELDRPFDPEIWNRALEWHLSKWPDSRLQDPVYRHFCRKLYAKLSEQGHLGMSYIEIDGRLAAVNVCHYMNRKVYGKMMNYSPEFAKKGIGLVLLARLLEHYRDRGMEEYDFEGGTQDYKFYWTDTLRRNFNHYVANSNRKKAYVCLCVWAGIFARQSGTFRHWQIRFGEWKKRATLRRRSAGENRGEEAEDGLPSRSPGGFGGKLTAK